MGFRWMTRWAVIALVAVIATMAAGGGVAAAAADSLPGAWLYPVKLAVEDVRLEFAAGPTAQAEMALHLADERLAEMEALVQNGQPVPEQVTLRMERHLQRALEGAAQAPEPQMLALLAQIAERTQTQLQVLERVRSMAPQAAQQGLERAWQACQQSHNAAAQGLDDPQTFRWHHQHREGAPDEVQPPVPPTVAPPGGGAQPGGPAPTCTPGAGPQQDRQRSRGDQHRPARREPARSRTVSATSNKIAPRIRPGNKTAPRSRPRNNSVPRNGPRINRACRPPRHKERRTRMGRAPARLRPRRRVDRGLVGHRVVPLRVRNRPCRPAARRRLSNPSQRTSEAAQVSEVFLCAG